MATNAFVRHFQRDLETPYACVLMQTHSQKVLFVGDNTSRVKVFNVYTGDVLRDFFLDGDSSEDNDLQKSMVIHYAAAGPQLIISEYKGHKIQVFHALTGNHIRNIGLGEGNGNGNYFHPDGMAVITQKPPARALLHLLAVCDQGNQRIAMFNLEDGIFFKNIPVGMIPTDVKVFRPPDTPANSNPLIFVSCYSNEVSGCVKVIDAINGNHLREIGAGVLNQPRGLGIYQRTDQFPHRYLVCVSEWNSHRLATFDALLDENQAPVYIVNNGQGNGNNQLNNPCKLCFL